MLILDHPLRTAMLSLIGVFIMWLGNATVALTTTGLCALLMHQAGYKVIGIGEWDGGLYNSKGIDIQALTDYRAKEGHIHGFKGAERAMTEELLITDCDILVPAATENVITSLNADKVKARILVEGANGPTTAVADDILADKHVFVMPDILANAGGVTASYFEWVQNLQAYS